jgi:hypothetical protein
MRPEAPQLVIQQLVIQQLAYPQQYRKRQQSLRS